MSLERILDSSSPNQMEDDLKKNEKNGRQPQKKNGRRPKKKKKGRRPQRKNNILDDCSVI